MGNSGMGAERAGTNGKPLGRVAKEGRWRTWKAGWGVWGQKLSLMMKLTLVVKCCWKRWSLLSLFHCPFQPWLWFLALVFILPHDDLTQRAELKENKSHKFSSLTRLTRETRADSRRNGTTPFSSSPQLDWQNHILSSSGDSGSNPRRKAALAKPGGWGWNEESLWRQKTGKIDIGGNERPGEMRQGLEGRRG